ncbi:MAG: anti-sigma factor family protein [Pyrinomonadaceae bacterium]
MTCEETQQNLSPYVDGRLAHDARAELKLHLEVCPVCRLHLSQTRALVRGLGGLERPIAPPGLAAAITDALTIERAAVRLNPPPSSIVDLIFRWLRPRLMPYTVGAFASILLFFTVASALRRQVGLLHELTVAAHQGIGSTSDIVLRAGPREYDVLAPINLATSRAPFGAQSPSLNPNGALATLIRTPTSGNEEDDDTVIVADVFSNGSASLAEVVSAPRNPQMLDEVQDALRRDPAFVPAAFDQRPQTMRVVISLSKVSVQERSF